MKYMNISTFLVVGGLCFGALHAAVPKSQGLRQGFGGQGQWYQRGQMPDGEQGRQMQHRGPETQDRRGGHMDFGGEGQQGQMPGENQGGQMQRDQGAGRGGHMDFGGQQEQMPGQGQQMQRDQGAGQGGWGRTR